MKATNDIRILGELAKRYIEIAHLDIQEEKRKLWRDHFSLKETRIPILATYGMWNVWCREIFSDNNDYSLTAGYNQQESYEAGLKDPEPNSPCKRSDIWGFCAAQEMTLISPEFHNEFMLQYQLPIFEHFGAVHYGCCEDLTKKIDMLRQLKNLRSIAITPTADVASCAEQIGKDYVSSWRPNPANMICCGFNPDLITKIISKGVQDTKSTLPHIHLKDIETLEGDITRLKKWVNLVKGITT